MPLHDHCIGREDDDANVRPDQLPWMLPTAVKSSLARSKTVISLVEAVKYTNTSIRFRHCHECSLRESRSSK